MLKKLIPRLLMAYQNCYKLSFYQKWNMYHILTPIIV